MDSQPQRQADAFKTIVFGGLVIGLLDGLFAITFYGAYGATFDGIWKSVATGLLGPAARIGGAEMVALGLFLHFVVAFGVATVFYVLTRFLPVLLRQAVLVGLVYGLVAYAVMNLVVVPLSRIPARAKPKRIEILLSELAGHALLVGLPVALIARWSSRPKGSG